MTEIISLDTIEKPGREIDAVQDILISKAVFEAEAGNEY